MAKACQESVWDYEHVDGYTCVSCHRREAQRDRDGRDPLPNYYEEVGCPQGYPRQAVSNHGMGSKEDRRIPTIMALRNSLVNGGGNRFAGSRHPMCAILMHWVSLGGH